MKIALNRCASAVCAVSLVLGPATDAMNKKETQKKKNLSKNLKLLVKFHEISYLEILH